MKKTDSTIKAEAWTDLDLPAFQTVFQPYLEAFLAERQHAAEKTLDNVFLHELLSYPAALLAGGGKRQRPYVAWLMYRAGGGQEGPEVLKLLAALETFHLFCLIHDDIIDRGTERHGMPTLHEQVRARLKTQQRLGALERLADGQAILIGDLLFAWVQDAFWQTSLPPERVRHARAAFGQMAQEVVLGQMIDVDMMTCSTVSDSQLERKMLLKTASYTFIRPLQIGLRLAIDNPELDRFCESFGCHFGLAFQIQDDYLDLTAVPISSQKTLFSDLREGQHTVFTQYIFTEGSTAEKQRLRSLFGTPVTAADRDDILELFTNSGALEHGRHLMEAHFTAAHDALSEVELDATTVARLGALVETIRQRSA